MASRLQLHNELKELLGNNNVYFQPPESFKLKFPAIVYEHATARTYYADDIPYHFARPYKVTLIQEDPDSDLPDKLGYKFQTIRQTDHFCKDNRYHDTFILYY